MTGTVTLTFELAEPTDDEWFASRVAFVLAQQGVIRADESLYVLGSERQYRYTGGTERLEIGDGIEVVEIKVEERPEP